MVSLQDFLASQLRYRQDLAEQDQRAKAGQMNPLAVIAGLVAGGLTGGLGGAALGGLGGLGSSVAEGGAGVAKAGLGGYSAGKGLAESNKLETAFPELAGMPSDMQKAFIDQIAKERHPTGLDRFYGQAADAAVTTKMPDNLGKIISDLKASGMSSDDILKAILK